MIRKADIKDLSRIAEIIIFGKRVAYRHIFEDDYGSFHKLQVVDLYEEYKSNLNVLEGMLLYDDGIVKGVINGRPKDGQIMEITEFYVDPFFVGQGIGTLLMKYMIRQTKEKGYRKIILWVIKDNVRARKFYEMNGFVNSGKTCIIEGTTKEDCCYECVLE
ncbi:MAG TPA: N-acetyltransferase [Lachnospiraceae bacterium]|nr:N-acetyltransferase [Lachnospiraceae bacterium]